MEDISKKPTIDIITEMSDLERDINLSILKYEKLRLEIVKRFPNLNKYDEFKAIKLRR